MAREGGRIAIRLRCDGRGATVKVQDNGRGVLADRCVPVFENFHQGGNADKRPQGSGPGLPISRQIVEHLGGRRELPPDAGQGACFASTLPWQTPEPAPAGAAAAHAGDKT